jgi:hypothetical protein
MNQSNGIEGLHVAGASALQPSVSLNRPIQLLTPLWSVDEFYMSNGCSFNSLTSEWWLDDSEARIRSARLVAW